jgi:hypothetical protein
MRAKMIWEVLRESGEAWLDDRGAGHVIDLDLLFCFGLCVRCRSDEGGSRTLRSSDYPHRERRSDPCGSEFKLRK